MTTPGPRGRRGGCLAALLLSLVIAGCAAQPATPTASPRPSTVPLAETTTLAPTTSSAGPASGPLTGQERAWLKAITRLEQTLKDVFIDGAVADSPASLKAVADRLRDCRGELAHLGRPSPRLQPAHQLASEACAQAGKAARCFTTAATLGTPIPGSATERKIEHAIDCGLEATTEAITLLIDAETAGEDVQDTFG